MTEHIALSAFPKMHVYAHSTNNNKKSAHNECTFRKKYYLCRCNPEKGIVKTLRRAISFYPSENLENSAVIWEKSEGCFSCSVYIAAIHLYGHLTYIFLQVWADFILYITGIPEPSDKECQKAHTSVYIHEHNVWKIFNKNNNVVWKSLFTSFWW